MDKKITKEEWNYRNDFIHKLLQYRREHRLTQKQFAKMLNIPYRTYQNMENIYLSNPGLDKIYKVKKYIPDILS